MGIKFFYKKTVQALNIFCLNILTALILIFLIIILVTLSARFLGRDYYNNFEKAFTLNECQKSLHYKLSYHQAQLLGKDLTELNKYCNSLMEISNNSKNRQFTYWDYHLYSEPLTTSPYINFADTLELNARSTPCSKKSSQLKNHKVIWLFGGSTMQNGETSDQNTIANILCESFLDTATPLKVINLGVGGFLSETEIIKFINLSKLNLVKQDLIPSYVIFYDGFNDSERLKINGRWAGLPGNVSEKISSQLSVTRPAVKALYWFLRSINQLIYQLANHKVNPINDLINRALANLLQETKQQNQLIFETKPADSSIQGYLLSSISYIYDQKILSGICKSLEIKCLTILQPLAPLRNIPIGEIERNNYDIYLKDGTLELTKRFYEEIYPEIKKIRNNYYDILNLSDFPNMPEYSKFPHFYDLGHTGYYSSEMIGKEISFRIRNLKNNKDKQWLN
jgi:hypothetical protein